MEGNCKSKSILTTVKRIIQTIKIYLFLIFLNCSFVGTGTRNALKFQNGYICLLLAKIFFCSIPYYFLYTYSVVFISIHNRFPLHNCDKNQKQEYFVIVFSPFIIASGDGIIINNNTFPLYLFSLH